jgi:hypothetical protein
MSTSEQRLAANRVNALGSTGPVTLEGKRASSQNAIRHGLLSSKLLLDDEEPGEFQELFSHLCHSLGPVGAIEELLAERIAVAIWRQMRLVRSETACLTLSRQPKKVAGGVSAELGRSYGSEVKADELAPFDAERAEWCQKAMEELEGLTTIELASISQLAPLVHAQLASDADEDETIEKYLAGRKGGLTTYLAELTLWCRQQLKEAETRPNVLAIAAEIRSKQVVLAADVQELMARYQTTLDNQLYKALRALRDAQAWRLKTLEPLPAREPATTEEVAEAA